MKQMLIILAVVSSFCLKAQDSTLQIGGHLGYGLSGVVGTNATASGTAFSPFAFQVGVNVFWPFSNHFGIYSALSYSAVDVNTELLMRPYPSLSGEIESFKYPYSFTSQYISLPVLFRARFGERTQLFIQGGLQFDFLIKRSLYADLTWPHASNPPEKPFGWGPIERDITEFGDAIELAGVLGLGVSIPLAKRLVVDAEIRGVLGFKSWQYGVDLESSGSYEGRQAQTILVIGARYILP